MGTMQWTSMHRNRLCARGRTICFSSGISGSMSYIFLFPLFSRYKFYSICFFEADGVAAYLLLFVRVFQISLLKKFIKRFYGDNLKSLGNLARIVNKHHFDRVHNLLKDPKVAASVVYGGSVDEENM